MNSTTRWQYKVEKMAPVIFSSIKKEALEASLNSLGREGWELVSVTMPTAIAGITLYLKRPI